MGGIFMKKKLLIVSLVAVLLFSLVAFFACGDNNDETPSDNKTPSASDAILPSNVNYANISFEEMSQEDAIAFLSTSDDSQNETFIFAILPNAHLQFKGSVGLLEEDASADIKYEDVDMFAAWKNPEDGTIENLVFSAKTGDDSYRIETYNDELRTQNSVGGKKSAYSLSMSQLLSDYYLKMYGLTPEQVAQKKADYEKAQQEKPDSTTGSENSSTSINDIVNYLISGMVSDGTLTLSKAVSGEKIHLKISVDGEKLISFATKLFSQIGIQIEGPLLPTINKLDIYATSNKGFFVDLKVALDMTARTKIAFLPIKYLSTMFDSVLKPAWLGDTKPIIAEVTEENVSATVVSAALSLFLPQDIENLQEKSFSLKGDLTFRYSKTTQKGSISKNSCSQIDLDGIIKKISSETATN